MSHDARERCVIVCPQCEGEGGYPDGVDEDACHMDCTRCGGNGWIVDLAALSPDLVLLGEVRQALLVKAMLCLSGFAGCGFYIEGFEDPADVYCEIAKELNLEDADDEELRAILAKLPKLTGEEV